MAKFKVLPPMTQEIINFLKRHPNDLERYASDVVEVGRDIDGRVKIKLELWSDEEFCQAVFGNSRDADLNAIRLALIEFAEEWSPDGPVRQGIRKIIDDHLS